MRVLAGARRPHHDHATGPFGSRDRIAFGAAQEVDDFADLLFDPLVAGHVLEAGGRPLGLLHILGLQLLLQAAVVQGGRYPRGELRTVLEGPLDGAFVVDVDFLDLTAAHLADEVAVRQRCALLGRGGSQQDHEQQDQHGGQRPAPPGR
jgi:hypothetical protein